MSDRDQLCVCGHPQWRHFSGSMVKGYHACLVVEGKTPCECRRFRLPVKMATPWHVAR